jgi:hypothetical protein
MLRYWQHAAPPNACRGHFNAGFSISALASNAKGPFKPAALASSCTPPRILLPSTPLFTLNYGGDPDSIRLSRKFRDVVDVRTNQVLLRVRGGATSYWAAEVLFDRTGTQ